MANRNTNRAEPRRATERGGRRHRADAPAARTTVVESVRARVSEELNTRKDRLTRRLDHVAETVRRVGEPLHEEPFTALGEYVEGAAGRLERLAGDLRERGVEELARDLADLARRRPAAFVGASLAAGIVAARFLKSSPRSATAAGGQPDEEHN